MVVVGFHPSNLKYDSAQIWKKFDIIEKDHFSQNRLFDVKENFTSFAFVFKCVCALIHHYRYFITNHKTSYSKIQIPSTIIIARLPPDQVHLPLIRGR